MRRTIVMTHTVTEHFETASLSHPSPHAANNSCGAMLDFVRTLEIPRSASPAWNTSCVAHAVCTQQTGRSQCCAVNSVHWYNVQSRAPCMDRPTSTPGRAAAGTSPGRTASGRSRIKDAIPRTASLEVSREAVDDVGARAGAKPSTVGTPTSFGQPVDVFAVIAPVQVLGSEKATPRSATAPTRTPTSSSKAAVSSATPAEASPRTPRVNPDNVFINVTKVTFEMLVVFLLAHGAPA